SMSEQAGYSPNFKRPSEIMRMRRKRARLSTSGRDSTESPGQSDSSPSCVRPFSPGPLFNPHNRPGAGIKRRNPFASIENTYSPKKKLVIYNDDGNVEAVDLNKMKKSSEKEGDEDMSRKTDCRTSLPFSARLTEAEKSSIAPPVCTRYPADWSLKTRLLFTSPMSLSWAEQPKAQEEALGIAQHCRAQFSSLSHSPQDPKSCSELRCAFQQSLVYWQHPSIPWIPLFPRINAERRLTGKNSPWAQDIALQQSLMSEWAVSLSSLYSLMKARLCPYFYLCSYQFTVLFRAAGLAGSSSISALISPTTRGLREAMKAEGGIEFSLPLVEERKRSNEGEPQEDEGVEEKEKAGSLSWLKAMGVQDKIKRPDSITAQLRKEGSTVLLDHKPESVVCVEGSHTFTLINFLINCKSLVAVAGSQGLPPTLLAPVAFRGATMHTLKARSVNVKSQVGSVYQNISSLEITGPILPTSLHSITTLLRPAQKGNFSATLYTHTPTAVMNTHTTKDQGPEGSVDLSACGLHPVSVEQFKQPSSLGKTALTHISMNNYSYTWKS
uniref:Downstream neighbor of SON n=1 Tax=Tetraodon nigroviridis TaxID=99883 RepID=H3CS98_TETNG